MASQARSRSFLISTAVMMLLAFLATAVPGFIANREDSGKGDKVAVVGEAASMPDVAGFEFQPVADQAAAEKLVRSGKVKAALVPDPETKPGGVRVIALDSEPGDLVALLTVAPPVELLDPPKVPRFLQMGAATVFAVLFFWTVMMWGQTAATNTVVEKQTRVIEILLAAVPARVLLAGKVLSGAVLALGSLVAMLLALIAGLFAGGAMGKLADAAQQLALALGQPGSGALFSLMAPSLASLLVLFLVAFVMFAALMVGSAATVSRMEDAGAVLMPSMMLLAIPYVLVVTFNQSRAVVTWLSYIPFSAPMAMPLRLIQGDAAWWEPLVALALLALTTWLAVLAGGRLYENSILRTGARTKLKEAWRKAS
jgi:ABC-2 type transport system permease protein